MASRSAFFGRARETELIGELLVDHPVVTLVGPGGIGKTRLALEVAAGQQGRYAGGVRLVELHGIAETEALDEVVARQLGLDSVEALQYLGDEQPVLLVVDNCESDLVRAAALVATLVGDDPARRVLATSRVPLGVEGERVFPVGPLELPRDDQPDGAAVSAAVQLFLDRAARAGAQPLPDDVVAGDVTRLVQGLDGMPLAIELAAARARVLSPAQLLASLEDELDLLRRPGGPTDRHRSIRATFHSSYEPLPPHLQRGLRRLAVVTEPFDLDLATTLLAESGEEELDVVELLSRLVDASLVDATADAEGHIRFRLLEPIRRCGWDLLEEHGELEAAANRYVDSVVALADSFIRSTGTAFTAELVARLSQAYVHFVKALDWCVALDATVARANRLVIALYSETRSDTLRLVRRLRFAWEGAAPLDAEAHAVMGAIGILAGAADEVDGLLHGALDDPRCSEPGRMVAFRALGYAAAYRGDFPEARRQLDVAVQCAGRFSASFARQLELDRAATITDPVEAEAMLGRVDEISREVGTTDEPLLQHWAAMVTALLHLRSGNNDAALRAVSDAQELVTQTGHPWSLRIGERTRSTVIAVRDGWDAAAPVFRSALDASLTQGDLADAATTLRAAAGASMRAGDDERARLLWAAVPHGHGRSIIPSFFAVEERQLEDRIGTRRSDDLRASMRTARALLARVPVDAPAPMATPAPAAGGDVLRFGDFEIDPTLFELRRRGERVRMEPQVFEVLCYLAQRRGALVTKNELLDEIWGSRFVSESTLTSRVKAARRATADDGRTQAVIRTVHGRGYVFVADVEPVPNGTRHGHA